MAYIKECLKMSSDALTERRRRQQTDAASSKSVMIRTDNAEEVMYFQYSPGPTWPNIFSDCLR